MWSKARLIWFLGRTPGISRALRWYANRYKDGSVVRIRSGYAKGMRWRRYHRYVNGYWIGQYELPIQEAIVRELNESYVFYDVGANAGFFSLIASRKVKDSGTVVSFDPDPDNCQSMQQQIKLNNITNWIVSPQALFSEPGTMPFSRTKPGSSTGHLGDAGDAEERIEVEVSTLDTALDSFPAPHLVKMDIEGAEGQALAGATRMIAEVRPVWLIELHGPKCANEVERILEQARYIFHHVDGKPLPQGISLPHHVLARPL